MSVVDEKEDVVFEIAVAVTRFEGNSCVEVLFEELRKRGLILERVCGVQNEFIKIAAPLRILGEAAAELKFRKITRIGLLFPFEWDEAKAFVTLPDGTLFSWSERYCCYKHILYGIVNQDKLKVLNSDSGDIKWESGESLIRVLEMRGIVKEVFPLHDENKRKQLLRSWAMNWLGFTSQPIDEICLYYGLRIATYFEFLGMYTKWMLFPAALGILVHLIDFGSLQFLVLPFFFICLISWSVLFFQFWKRKNSALSARFQNYHAPDPHLKTEDSSFSFRAELSRKRNADRMNDKAIFQRQEWLNWMMRLRNDFIIIMSIICLQLPFELAYAHLFEVLDWDILKGVLTAVYLFTIQYLTRMGGRISVNLIKYEDNENAEYQANSLVYKVFGLYFMQSYIGIFYHALIHRNIQTLRQVLIQRLIISEVVENLLENSIPCLSYSFRKFRAIRMKQKLESESSVMKTHIIPRVEKDFLKPIYAPSIGQGIEDGLFDDFLELVLQFGMMMMFACAFPLAFAFAVVNNLVEIRADSLKLLTMMRRPVPRAEATIGAWLNIFQFLIVISICTNSALLVCLYDQEGTWSLSPGLAVILVIEHLLLLIKFGFSRLVPEEPAWVKAIHRKIATQAEEMCSKQMLRSISRHEGSEEKKKRK